MDERILIAHGDPYRYAAVETHLIESRHVDQAFRIDAALPPRRESDTEPLPVVYASDGNLGFRMLKEISCMLQMMGVHPFPAFILVGIGYPSDLQFAGLKLRARDFTHAGYPKIDMRSVSYPVEGILEPAPASKDYAGAEDFQRFIEDELIAFIDERYDTSCGDRTYFGHSGGGFFGLHTLFSRPQLFRNYIVSSPGLSFRGRDFALELARDFIASGRSLEGVKLYLSAGLEEDFQPLYYDIFHLTSQFFRLAALLKNAQIPGLELMVEPLPGEVHMTAYPIAFIHGLQAVFGTRRIGGMY
jgi:predicted alpha/beta superfamily hydrolase